jgi:methylmalonyl-CoA mutase, N-terminal domain
MSLKDEKRRWQEKIEASHAHRKQERKPEFQTPSGIPLPPILTPADSDPDYRDQLSFPGEYPFTRGVQSTMYRGRLWTMRQYAGYANRGKPVSPWPSIFPRR